MKTTEERERLGRSTWVYFKGGQKDEPHAEAVLSLQHQVQKGRGPQWKHIKKKACSLQVKGYLGLIFKRKKKEKLRKENSSEGGAKGTVHGHRKIERKRPVTLNMKEERSQEKRVGGKHLKPAWNQGRALIHRITNREGIDF